MGATFFSSMKADGEFPYFTFVGSDGTVTSLGVESLEMTVTEDGSLVYALLRFPADRARNKYVGYQVKEASGSKYVTVVYLTGKATASDLRVIFKQR